MASHKTLFLHAFALLAILSGSARSQTASPLEADWRAFRAVYPFHVQGVALSEPADGRQTLIIAEPPPKTTMAGLLQIDSAVFASPEIKTHKIGYDGWVKDIVVSFPARTPQETQRLIDRLHIYLFNTAYKSYVLNVSKDPSIHPPKVNIKVSAADLYKWLFQAKEQFHPSMGGSAATIRELLTSGRSGLYYSEKPGLVAMIVAKRTPLSAMTREIRRFSLDSDLILGATASQTHVAILARERVEPVQSLPPLRTETVLLLANAKTSQLSQSYERTNLFAGHVKKIGYDWAPIYLSDDLIDTEYGSLLNITDQMLKSWSCDGLVRYYNFTYNDPQQGWPFDQAISIDAKLHEVTFNWNTKGAGYLLDMNGQGIMALNRTGSLPVSYIPGEIDKTGTNPLKSYEERGYKYFSTLEDPNLVRVVQYALLYQIFREYGIQDDSQPPLPQIHPEQQLLARMAEKMLNSFLDGTTAELVQARLDDSAAVADEKRAIRVQLAHFRQEVDREFVYGPQLIPAIAARLANPRIDEPLIDQIRKGRSVASLSPAERLALTARDLAYDLEKTDFAASFAGTLSNSGEKPIYSTYAGEATHRPSVWIHTPSVVISRTKGALATAVGGHNLDSRIVRYRVSDQVPRGDVRVIDEGKNQVVLVSPYDAGKIPELLRTTALTPSKAELTAASRSILSRAVEPPSNLPRERILGYDSENPRLRGLSAKHVSAPVLGGWANEPERTATTNPAQSFSKLGTRAITIAKTPDFKFAVYYPESPTVITAESYDAAVDAVVSAMKRPDGPAGSWNLDLRGFNPAEARNFVRTSEVQFTAKERLQLAGFASAEDVNSPRVVDALSHEYDFRSAKIVEAVHGEALGEKGTVVSTLDMKVEIPSISPGKPSLITRIKLFFDRLIPESIQLAVQQAVEAIFVRAQLRGHSAANLPRTKQTMTAEILKGVKEDLKNVSVPGAGTFHFNNIHVSADFGDIYIADSQRYGSQLGE